MGFIQAFVLALVQGITEFLPVSSTAHLILVPLATDWPDQGLAFDVAMNTATWCAVVVYFRREIKGYARGIVRTIRERRLLADRDGELAWMALVSTVPVGVAGLLARDTVAGDLRTLGVIGVSSIVWGVALWLADMRPGHRDLRGLGWPQAVFVGIAQAVSLIPGTSRSGITITAGLAMGLDRVAAARFSYLLAIIVGPLAGAAEGFELARAGASTPWGPLAVGFVVAFVSSYLAIHYFLRLISHASMAPFVVYRLLLGGMLLYYAW